jgi:tetratricopeptide (TPR) repeat protein
MDKNKILDAAAKLVAKGAYDKAIKEYQKVLEADPKDVRVLHKLGELYEKKNDSVQAATFFTRVADGYASDGFSMKAIALYKKVLKLDPNLLEVNLKLAELHQQHQLMSEAMAYYQVVANQYDRAGNVRASLDTLKKMVELDPENVASRIKLAELYARENMNAEALPEFKRAAEHLKLHARFDDYLRIAERISSLEPQNVEIARELAAEYLSKGDQKRALAKLQLCFKADPRDIQTLNLLAQAFHGLGHTSKTISVYKELTRIYTEQRRPEEAARVWTKIEQLDPNDPEVRARRVAQRESAAASASRPGQASPSASTRGHSAGPAAAHSGGSGAAALSRDQLNKLLTETDVYVKYGLHDKALEHLRRVFSVEPENLEAHEKAYNIYVAARNPQAASEQLLNVLRLCTRRNEVKRAEPYLATLLQQAPNHPEVPAFLAVLRPRNAPTSPRSYDEPAGDEEVLVASADAEIIVDPPSESAEDEDLALAAARTDVDGDVVDEPAFASGSEDDEPLAARNEDEIPTEALPPVDDELDASGAEPASDECDEAGFLIDQGLFEEAREILDPVLARYPNHPRAKELMRRLPRPPSRAAQPAAHSEDEGKDAFDLAAELAVDEAEITELPEDSFVEDYQVSVDEVFSEFKKGLEKIVKPEDVDTHYDLGIAYKEMGLVDDAIGEFRIARQGCIGHKKEVDCLTMIGLLHMQKGNAKGAIDAFKEALTNEQATPDMAKSLRFELATAWQSAGSPGKAVHHFRAVAAIDPKYRDVALTLRRMALVQPEHDPLPPRAAKGAPGSSGRGGAAPKSPGKTGKVGYV